MDTFISWDAAVFYALTLAGIVGHAITLWFQRKIDYSVWDYLFKVDPRDTAYTVATALGGTMTMLSTKAVYDYHVASQVIAVTAAAFAVDHIVLPPKAPTGANNGPTA